MKSPVARDYFLGAAVMLIVAAVTWSRPPSIYSLRAGLLWPLIVMLTVSPPWRPAHVFGVSATTLALAGTNAGRMGTPWLMPMACLLCGAAMLWAGLSRDKGSPKMEALARALLLVVLVIAILFVPYVMIGG